MGFKSAIFEFTIATGISESLYKKERAYKAEWMAELSKTPRETITAPYGREIRLAEVEFESGMHLLRVQIREGNRFTLLDLDPTAALQWGRAMSDWASSRNA